MDSSVVITEGVSIKGLKGNGKNTINIKLKMGKKVLTRKHIGRCGFIFGFQIGGLNFSSYRSLNQFVTNPCEPLILAAFSSSPVPPLYKVYERSIQII